MGTVLGSLIAAAARELALKRGRIGFGHTTNRFNGEFFELLYAWRAGQEIKGSPLRAPALTGPKCKSGFDTACFTGLGIVSKGSPLAALDDLWERGSYNLTCETAINVAFAMGTRQYLGDMAFVSTCPEVILSVFWSFDERIVDIRDDSDGAFEPIAADEAFRRGLRPGDGVYFFNPDVADLEYWYVGENAVFLGGDRYAAWPIGVMTERELISALNAKRKRGAATSAYLAAYYQRVSEGKLRSVAA